MGLKWGFVGGGYFRAVRRQLLVVLSVALVALGTLAIWGANPAAADTVTGWQPDAVYPIYPSVASMSCPSAAVCFAVGSGDVTGGILETTDGGATWSGPVFPQAQYPQTNLNSISCPSVSVCVAVGGGISSSSDGGATWTSQSAPGGAFLVGVGCPSISNCYAVGFVSDGSGGDTPKVVATTDGGTTWSTQGTPLSSFTTTSTPTGSVECPTISECLVALNATLIETANGGAAWSVETPLANYVPASISCPAPNDCFVAEGGSQGGAITATADGGVTWSTLMVTAHPLVGISCASATDCEAVGGYQVSLLTFPSVFGTTDGGATWTQQSPSPQFQTSGWMLGVNCPAAGTCFAYGYDQWFQRSIAKTTDGGSSWAAQTLPVGMTNISSVTCPTPSTCFATGGEDDAGGSYVLASVDGGTTWSLETTPSGTAPTSIACPSSTVCYAGGPYTPPGGWASVGSAIVETNDGGATWTTIKVLGSGDTVGSIACPTTLNCIVVGKNIGVLETTDGGTTWSYPNIPTTLAPGNAILNSVSCSSPTSCMAVGSNSVYSYTEILSSTDGGLDWTGDTGPVLNPRWLTLNAVACPTATNCYVAGFAGSVPGAGSTTVLLATNDGGSTWTSNSAPSGASNINSIACPSATDCYAVSPSAVFSTTDGLTWTQDPLPSPSRLNPQGTYALNDIDCASITACVMVGGGLNGSAVGGVILSGPVSLSTTTTTVSASPSAAAGGQEVSFSATVSPTSGTAPPSGAVTFTEQTSAGIQTLCSAALVGGVATCASAAAQFGTDTITASYGGDASYAGSSGTAQLTVGVTTTSVSVNQTPVTAGTSVTFTTNVASASGVGQPTGTVVITRNGLTLCTITLFGGSGSCASVNATPGDDLVTATYSGDASFLSSTGSTDLSVGPTATVLSFSPSTAPFGSTVTYSATVSGLLGNGVPTGSVTFYMTGLGVPGYQPLCTATLSDGAASCQSAFASVGQDTVIAEYSGDANYGSSDSVGSTLTLTPAPTSVTVTATPSPVGLGGVVTYSATVSPASGLTPLGSMDGTVTFSTGGSTLCSADVTTSGSKGGPPSVGTCTSSSAPLGTDTVEAQYSGNWQYEAGSGDGTLVVLPATTTTVSVSPTTTAIGQYVLYTATVHPAAGSQTPTGSVAFDIGTSPICTATLANGTASCTSSAAPAGSDTVAGSYSGSPEFAPSTGSASLTVTQLATTTTASVSPTSGPVGTTVTLSATVAPRSGPGSPTGTVAFTYQSSGSTVCTASLAGGSGSCTAVIYGDNVIRASYSGDATYASSLSTTEYFGSQAPSTTTVSVSPSSVTQGAAVTYSATVTSAAGTPTGSVTFELNTQFLCTAVLNAGTGSCTATASFSGTYQIEGNYSGDTADQASTGTAYVTGLPPQTLFPSPSKALIGNQVITATGADWTTSGDTSVSLYECTTTTLSAACTGVLATAGTSAGRFSTKVSVVAGTIDSTGDKCGLAGSPVCYLVAVGGSGVAVSQPIGFAVPSVTLSKTPIANRVETLTTKGFPIGDTIEAIECDAGANASNEAQHCDATTAVTGVANARGTVPAADWSNGSGLTIVVDQQYSDPAGGSCATGSTCAVVVVDQTRPEISQFSLISLSTPVITVTKATAVVGNYGEGIRARNFPVGDTLVAEECDSSASVSNFSTHCDPATGQTEVVASTGMATFSPGVTMLMDTAYSDGVGGVCNGGSGCYVVVTDTDNPQITVMSRAIQMAIPTVTISPSVVAGSGTRLVTVTAKFFPIGDAVEATECDSAFTQAGSSLAANCDGSSPADISGVAGSTGLVSFAPTSLTILTNTTSPAYVDAAAGTCVAGGKPCYIATSDLANPSVVVVSRFTATT